MTNHEYEAISEPVTLRRGDTYTLSDQPSAEASPWASVEELADDGEGAVKILAELHIGSSGDERCLQVVDLRNAPVTQQAMKDRDGRVYMQDVIKWNGFVLPVDESASMPYAIIDEQRAPNAVRGIYRDELTVIGRGEEDQRQFGFGPSVSRAHLTAEVVDGGLCITDTSSNGTRLVPLGERPVHDVTKPSGAWSDLANCSDNEVVPAPLGVSDLPDLRISGHEDSSSRQANAESPELGVIDSANSSEANTPEAHRAQGEDESDSEQSREMENVRSALGDALKQGQLEARQVEYGERLNRAVFQTHEALEQLQRLAGRLMQGPVGGEIMYAIANQISDARARLSGLLEERADGWVTRNLNELQEVAQEASNKFQAEGEQVRQQILGLRKQVDAVAMDMSTAARTGAGALEESKNNMQRVLALLEELPSMRSGYETSAAQLMTAVRVTENSIGMSRAAQAKLLTDISNLKQFLQ